MYEVTKTMHIRLPNGRSVVLQVGRRGVQNVNGQDVDLDEKLRRALGPEKFQELIDDGDIIERY